MSREFREWWPKHDVLSPEEGTKIIRHPKAGDLYFEHLPFQAYESADLRVTIHIPPIAASGTADKLKRLLADSAV